MLLSFLAYLMKPLIDGHFGSTPSNENCSSSFANLNLLRVNEDGRPFSAFARSLSNSSERKVLAIGLRDVLKFYLIYSDISPTTRLCLISSLVISLTLSLDRVLTPGAEGGYFTSSYKGTFSSSIYI